jgi:hypothetical protein
LFQALELVRLDRRRSEAWRKAFEGPEGLRPGFAEAQLRAFDDDAAETAKRAPSAEARALFLKGAAAVRRRHMGRLADLEGGLLATRKRVEVETEIGRLAEAARADPDGYAGARESLGLLLAAAESLIKPERAPAVRAEAQARLAESTLEGLIATDRLEEAEERLGQEDGVLSVDAGRKARLERRLADAKAERQAKEAAERARRALALERRARAGLADDSEIGRAFADGAVGEARRDGLLAAAQQAAQRRQLRLALRKGVAEKLAQGAAFEPVRDRAAVEAYYDALLPSLQEAGADDDVFLREATDLVARTGVWPGRFKTFVETQLDAGPHAALAAQALARMFATAPAAVADAPRGDVAFAAAAARLIDAGVSADAALARARPFRGLPAAEDSELRAAEVFELRPHYREWVAADAGDGAVGVEAAGVDRFGRSFEDWFFRTGDASLSRGLAVHDLRADVWRADVHAATDEPQPEPIRAGDDDGPASAPEPLRPDDEEPDRGACPAVHRPGWECDGGGFWRPAEPGEHAPQPEPFARPEPDEHKDDRYLLRAEAADGDGDGGGDGGEDGDEPDDAGDNNGEDPGKGSGGEDGRPPVVPLPGWRPFLGDDGEQIGWITEAGDFAIAMGTPFPDAADAGGEREAPPADGKEAEGVGVADLAKEAGLDDKEAEAAAELMQRMLGAGKIDTSAVDGKTEAEMREMLEQAGIVNAAEIAALGKEAVANTLELAAAGTEPGTIASAFGFVSGILRGPEPINMTGPWPGGRPR